MRVLSVVRGCAARYACGYYEVKCVVLQDSMVCSSDGLWFTALVCSGKLISCKCWDAVVQLLTMKSGDGVPHNCASLAGAQCVRVLA